MPLRININGIMLSVCIHTHSEKHFVAWISSNGTGPALLQYTTTASPALTPLHYYGQASATPLHYYGLASAYSSTPLRPGQRLLQYTTTAWPALTPLHHRQASTYSTTPPQLATAEPWIRTVLCFVDPTNALLYVCVENKKKLVTIINMTSKIPMQLIKFLVTWQFICQK